MSRDPEGAAAGRSLGDVMSRVARRLQEQHGDVEGTLQAITAAAVATVPNAEECSISYVIGRRTVEPRAATSELPERLDTLQQQLGEGPCLDAAREAEVVSIPDMADEERWPDFARQASGAGIGSMMCVQLFVAGDQLGAMNLYARTAHAFDDEGREIGEILAGHAAIALAGAEHEEHLRTGMGNRDVIGQAKGILMERFRITPDRAFGILARASQETNRKLVDIARELSETGAMPPTGRRD